MLLSTALGHVNLISCFMGLTNLPFSLIEKFPNVENKATKIFEHKLHISVITLTTVFLQLSSAYKHTMAASELLPHQDHAP